MLTDLDLHGQEINDLDDICEQYLSKLPNLVSLNLSDNHITKITPHFHQYLK
jgi:Leucine-rich repeat (LRR) protein